MHLIFIFLNNKSIENLSYNIKQYKSEQNATYFHILWKKMANVNICKYKLNIVFDIHLKRTQKTMNCCSNPICLSLDL